MGLAPDQLERELVDLFQATSGDVDPAGLGTIQREASGRRNRRRAGTALGSGLVVATLVGGVYAVPHLVDARPESADRVAVAASVANPSVGTPSAIIPDWPPPNSTRQLIPDSVVNVAMRANGSGSQSSPGPRSVSTGTHSTQTTLLFGLEKCSADLVAVGDLAILRTPFESLTQHEGEAVTTDGVLSSTQDITVSVFPTGRAESAWQSYLDPASACTTVNSPVQSGPDRLTVDALVSAGDGQAFRAGSLERVGDVLIGVVLTRPAGQQGDPHSALLQDEARAEVAATAAAVRERVLATMPQAKG